LNIQNGGALTASQVVLKGTDSALNLGDGTGISTATTKVDLNDASARLNFNSGQLAASEGGALVYGAGQVNLNGPAYISTTFTNSSIGNVIAGSGGLTKTGAGTLILTNTNAYTGTTTVSAGTLQAKKAAALPNYSTTGTISVAYGATLAVNAGAGSPTEWSDTEIQGLLANANVTFATGASFGIDTTGGDFAYGFDITKNNCDMCLTKLGSNTLTLTGTGTWTSSTTVSAGTLKIQNGGRIGDFDGCVGDNSSSNATVTVDGMGSIWGNYYSLTVGLHGTGTLNIQNGGQVGCFWGSLGDYSGSSGTVTVDGSGSIWNNGGTLYVGGWGDDPGGTGSLTVKNGGQVTVGDTLKMLKADSEVTVSGATLTAGALEGSTGTIRITDPVEGTALTVGSGTFSGIILDDTGPGSLTKVGVGTLALTGASTYSGGTTLSAGTLFVNNTSGSGTGSGTVTVNSTGTLGGTGTIGGATTISGHHAPGSSAGIQTFLSDLTYNASSDVTWELVANTPTQGPPAVFDQIVVGGDLDFAGATDLALVFNATGSAVDWFDAFWNTPQSWLVYDVAGMTSNFANLSLTVDNWADSTGALFNTALPSGSFSLSQSGQDVMLNYAPEPATLALLALGGVAALARRRRR